jgi:hypothetical protein
MKKTPTQQQTRRKLVMKTETLRRLDSLSESELEMVAGGVPKPSFAANTGCCQRDF